MIVGIDGGLGSGKTLLMTRYLKKDFDSGAKIYSNYHLKKIDYSIVDVFKILEQSTQDTTLKNVSIGIDEITVFADCRTSMAKMNRVFSYFILQTRKRNVTLYYTTQSVDMVDNRLRRHTDLYVTCEKVRNENDKVIENLRKYIIYDLRDKVTKIVPFIMQIDKYYDYYDTNEVILPPVK